jgi:Flp pilus assembly protein TadD
VTADERLQRGIALQMAGDLEGAAALYEGVLAGAPDHPRALGLLGTVRLRQGRPEEAAAAFGHLVALTPRDPEPQCLLALAREAQGQPEAALELLVAITLQSPDYVPAHVHAARLLGARRALAESAQHYRRWAELEPKAIAAHVELGVTLTYLGDLEEARTVLERAVALGPQHERAAASLANLLEILGEPEAAWTLLRPRVEAGAAGPDTVTAFAALAPRLDRVDQALALIEARLKDERIAASRPSLHFAAGRLRDRKGDYDSAFRHFERGNVLRRRPFDRAAHAASVDAVIRAFDAGSLARLPRASNRYRLPLFIVGMPRSGTTLVEQILASHPKVFGAGERREVILYARQLHAMLGVRTPYPECVADVDRPTLDTLAERHHETLRRLAPAADRVTDKMPHNFLHLGLIALLLPASRVIHLVRDARDTCLSCYFQDFASGHAYAHDLGDLGFYYRHYERLMAHWREVQPLPILEVRYEDLVADQEAESRRIVEFAGLEWDDRCLRFHELERPVATASHQQVRRPMYTGSLERWRRYEAHLGPLLSALDGEGGEN